MLSQSVNYAHSSATFVPSRLCAKLFWVQILTVPVLTDPVSVKKLASWLVYPLVGVRAEIIPHCL